MECSQPRAILIALSLPLSGPALWKVPPIGSHCVKIFKLVLALSSVGGEHPCHLQRNIKAFLSTCTVHTCTCTCMVVHILHHHTCMHMYMRFWPDCQCVQLPLPLRMAITNWHIWPDTVSTPEAAWVASECLLQWSLPVVVTCRP